MPASGHFQPSWILGFGLFISFRLFFLGTGLYHDDWVLLDHTLSGGSYWGAVEVFASKGILRRPLQPLVYPLLYFLAGAAPAAGQLLIFALEMLEGLLLYRLVSRLTGRPPLALLAAGLAMLFPNRAVMHVWVSNAFQPLAHIGLLASLLAHLNWIESRRVLWLAASLTSYLLSLLCYESTAFLPLILSGALWARKRLAGEPFFDALRQSLASITPYLAPLALALWWQHRGMLLVYPAGGIKQLSPSLLHFAKAYAAGFHCLTTGVLHAAARTLPAVWREFPWFLKLALLAAVPALWIPFRRALQGAPPAAKLPLLGAAAGCYLGAYAPFALSGTYTPQFSGLMSRTNGAGAWAGGMLLAASLASLMRRQEEGRGHPAAQVLLAALLCLFTWTNWQFSREWAGSWDLQRDIIMRAAPQARNLPASATVLLAGAPRHRGSAVVFDASWDFPYALRFATKRDDLTGNVVSKRMSFEQDGAVERSGGNVIWTHPYVNLYLYHYSSDSLVRLDGPREPSLYAHQPDGS